MTGSEQPASTVALDAAPYGGELRLRIADRNGRCVAVDQHHAGALRVLRPFYLDSRAPKRSSTRPDPVTYTIVNPGGAYLSRDRYSIALHLEDHTHCRILSQSAAKVYRTPYGRATVEQRCTLAPHSTLELLPEPLIMYRDGSFQQRTVVEMSASARFISSEIITPGWSPGGEQFAWDVARLDTEVIVDGRRAVVDRVRLAPTREFTELGFMEGFSHSGTMIVMDPSRVGDELRALIRAEVCSTPDSVRTGLGVVRGGIVVRSLAHTSLHLTDLHRRIAAAVRGYAVDERNWE